MRTLTVLFFLLCSLFPSYATELSVSGKVFFGEDQQPLPGYEVTLFFAASDEIQQTITDDEGAFLFEFDFDFDDISSLSGTVSVFDFCTGMELFEAIVLEEDFTVATGVNLTVCSNIDPPPPPLHCETFFFYEQVGVDPYEVQFFDLSSTSEPVDSWSWDFGDGNTSDESDPLHTYDEPGVYDVTLTVVADTCESVFVSPVFVEDFVPCDCDWTDYDPVCIEVFPGVVELFESFCYAQCAGYSADDVVDCGDNGYELCEAFFFYEGIADELTILFYNESFVYGDEIISFEWEFPNGEMLTEENPSYTFEEAGSYFVTLTIVTEDGCSSTFTQVVWVGDGNGGPCNCDDDFDPVCVINDAGVIITLPSACVAICSGYSPEDIFEDCSFDDCDCPLVFEPVCVELIPGFVFEFPNACVAECEGYDEDDFIDCEGNDDCYCPPYFEPVCVLVDGDTLTFENACVAECEGYDYEDFVECDIDGPCGCDWNEFDPVCVVTETGEIITFPNECLAACEGYDEEDYEDCYDDCYCPPIYAPVCVLVDGDTLTFENVCQAECEGFEYEDFIECDIDNPCDCDLDEFDPVCVATPSGLILTFQNECLAECQGYDESTFFDCDDPSDCECYQIYAPVCVTLPDGEVIVFPNDCYAQCEGFGPDEYELCDGAGEDFCEAHFDVLETDVPGQIQFLDYSFVIDAEITAWFWDFGDGNISDEQNPVHTYDITGMVDITLTITTDNGCSSTTTYPIFVGSGGGTGNGPECQAMFTFEQDEEELLSFYFEDLSMGEDVDSWFWSFGDGNSSTAQNPEYTYAAPGLYFVTLTITSGTCTSSMSMIILTDFDILYDEDCLALFVPLKTDSLTYAFLNLSSNFEADFAWDFGDGNTSNEPMPVHTYAAPGNYEVVLTLTTPDGCSSSFTATINPVINGFTGQPSFLMSTNTNDIYEQPLGQIKAYPNPATSRTTLDLDLQEGGAYQLRLLNLNGQEIWNQAYDWNAGRQQIDLDLSTVPAGMLMLQVQGKQGIETLRLIKQ